MSAMTIGPLVELVKIDIAKPRAGTIKRSAFWPPHDPMCRKDGNALGGAPLPPRHAHPVDFHAERPAGTGISLHCRIVEMEARVPQLVARAGNQTAGRIERTRKVPRRRIDDRVGPSSRRATPRSLSPAKRSVKKPECSEPSGRSTSASIGPLVRRVRDHLDHAAGEIDGGVVVCKNLAQRRELRQRSASRRRTLRAHRRRIRSSRNRRRASQRCG